VQAPENREDLLRNLADAVDCFASKNNTAACFMSMILYGNRS